MTEEKLKEMIFAYNAEAFPSFFSLRPLSETVTFGRIWLVRPTGKSSTESSYKFYFVLSSRRCVGIVLEMDEIDLHWYMLEEHRKQGHLHRALHDCILPHIFSDGREFQKVTAESPENADYVQKQGFIAEEHQTFRMRRNQVDPCNVHAGQNSPLSSKEIEMLKARLREAKALVMSVHEKLVCHYGDDAALLDTLANDIGDSAFQLSCLDNAEADS